MKRSSTLALVTVAGAAIIAYSWYSNNTEAVTDSDIFTSVSDCISSGVAEATCKARFGEAMTTYAQTAPRFVTKEDCEKDYGAGQCATAPTAATGETVATDNNTTTTAQASQATSGSTSYFMPMMMGFMAARMMQGTQSAASAAPLYGCAGGGAAGASCYSSNTGRSYYARTGAAAARAVKTPVAEFRSGNRAGFNVIPRGGSAIKSAVRSRGGFGSTGRGYSSRSYGG
ncbi:DUF1190 domain-containing protein [Microvirga sp. W0021]|uniref:DUF1190 domain-containing protein n=1 Tax=Hohaiivirga grylli TaxID=3133970 RepID=A0ABV0BKJ1_9HYPH